MDPSSLQHFIPRHHTKQIPQEAKVSKVSLLKQNNCQHAIIYMCLDNSLLSLYLSLCNILFPFFLTSLSSPAVSYYPLVPLKIKYTQIISQTKFSDVIKCYILIYQIIYWMTSLSPASGCYFHLKSLLFYEGKYIFCISLCLYWNSYSWTCVWGSVQKISASGVCDTWNLLSLNMI